MENRKDYDLKFDPFTKYRRYLKRDNATSGFENTFPLKQYYLDLLLDGHSFTRRAATYRDITNLFDEHLVQVAKRGLNVVAENVGKGGEGKSIISVYVAHRLKEIYQKLQKNPEATIEYTFDISQSKNAIAKSKRGSIIIQDEFNELIGSGKQIIKIQFNNLIRSFRETTKCYILNNIDYVPVKNLHFVIETYGFRKKFFKTKNRNDMSTLGFIRYVDDEEPSKRIYLGMVRFPIGSVWEEYENYLEIKKDNLGELEENYGKRSRKVDVASIKRKAKKLYNFAKKKGDFKATYRKIEKYYAFMGFNESSGEKKLIIDECHALAKKKK